MTKKYSLKITNRYRQISAISIPFAPTFFILKGNGKVKSISMDWLGINISLKMNSNKVITK